MPGLFAIYKMAAVGTTRSGLRILDHITSWRHLYGQNNSEKFSFDIGRTGLGYKPKKQGGLTYKKKDFLSKEKCVFGYNPKKGRLLRKET